MKKRFLINGLLAIFSFFVSLEAQIPTDGLVAFYLFNGNANDESGNENDASSYLITQATDRCGILNSAFYFNGIDNQISLPPANFIGLNEYTYSLWFKVTSLPSSSVDGWIIFASGSSTGSHQQILAINPDGSLSGISSNIGNNPVTTHIRTAPLQTDRWVHAVLIRDNTRLRIFVNGELMTNAGNGDSLINNQPANYETEPYSVTIGGRSNYGSYSFFNGIIDDISIYNRALSEQEIVRLFDSKCSVGQINGETEVCQGQQQVPYYIQIFNGASNYDWSYSGSGAVINADGANITIDFSDTAASGTLSVTITGDGMDEKSKSVFITVHPLPSNAGEISGEPEICAGENGVLYTTPTIPEAEVYIWHYNGSGATVSGNLNNISIDFDENATGGILTVTGRNSCGDGQKSPDFIIDVITCGEELPDPVIPNSFSPNGDGINDLFVIRDLPGNAKLMIFNRAGNLLYDTENYSNDWDGRDNKGNPLTSGTYWYVLSVPEIPQAYKGFVYLKN
ncbi:MAG: gliding motility-associated C-terminal domain-containing protein [Bacteroidales bacterium]|nr:gliding motility-associated C-terminal domain-containing protein [Bacteroidales bacterium]MBN2762823.1 gliding motility-associated C-terminal domain-containing protein [Bacteroidales bacterium]